MIVYLPLEHIEQRYTKHLDRDILKYLNNNSIEYKYLEAKVLSNEIKNGSFLDADNTIYRQFYQFMELIKGLQSGEIPKNSTLFVTDIWNFALLSIPYLNYFGNYNLKIKGVLHAGSFTDTDFVRNMERYYKNFEDSIFDICDQIFVGSEFIKQDIIRKRIINQDKILVTGLPMDFEGMNKFKPTNHIKRIIFNGRNVDEKQPYLFELLQNKYPKYEYINTQKENLTKNEYYKILSESKVVVSFALQENFGYGIQEAVYLGCSPVLPNKLAYKEQFDSSFLYDTFEQCCEKVINAVENPMKAKPFVTNNDDIFSKWFKL